ncbi:Protein transport protein sec9 [Neolecta irregularis DAH-3]|uniref:Protein transport protein sec9 n=1 Tax=Neolecta irregularis (strain DAH-3) TaxID=1198029 RepID=A0A1U7LI26_NEOID|nr:Protein transport protein sec9 [Neolecta irregularis DAH-3]|eukprot:OLL22202.1 Protein transport protein sec9 [Neolecta irregularis DAH-3]
MNKLLSKKQQPAPASDDYDRDRAALFGTSGRAPAATTAMQRPPSYASADPIFSSSSADPANSQGFSTMQEAEAEDVDEEVEGIKQELRFIKQESVASTRNALRTAQQAEETGRNTLAKLGSQSERISNVEKNLDIATIHNRQATEKGKELKTLNRSMFALHVKSPFGKAKREAAEEARIRERFEHDKLEREKTREFNAQSGRRVGEVLNPKGRPGETGYKIAGVAERSKYQFEADEEDDAVEKEIDGNLNQLAGVTSRLKGLALATNAEISSQNEKLDEIDRKNDKLGIGIHLNSERLKRIR